MKVSSRSSKMPRPSCRAFHLQLNSILCTPIEVNSVGKAGFQVMSELTIPLRGEFSLRECYFVWCFLSAVAVRAVVFFFEAADNYRKGDPQTTYWRTYWDCWNGITGKHVDLWLPFVIGFAELCAYPILIRSQQFQVIGAWLAIRT